MLDKSKSFYKKNMYSQLYEKKIFINSTALIILKFMSGSNEEIPSLM